MIDAATASLLESGCSIVLGLVTPDGDPHAARGWSLRVTSRDPLAIRLVVPAALARELGHDDLVGQAIAVTGSDVRTLRSAQLKGRVVGVEGATREDDERFRSHATAMFEAVHDVDGFDPVVLARMAPADIEVVTIAVDEVYDQTPGPGAGAPLVSRA